MSAAGLTAGIDGALQVAALLRGEAIAQAIQLDIQYAPEPPFDSGTPDRAPTEIAAKLKQITEQLTAQPLAMARRLAAKLGVQVDE